MPPEIGAAYAPYLAASLIWTIFGLSWLAAALWRGRQVTAVRPSSYRAQLVMASVGYLALFVEAPPLRHRLWLPPLAAQWGMVVLVVLGTGLAWWARIHLGALWSGGIVRREGHRVVDSGPYAMVRHPIYTGLILGAIGVAAIKATPVAIIGALLIAFGFGRKARMEERFLAAELGEDAYAAYRARVPMLVPFAPTR